MNAIIGICIIISLTLNALLLSKQSLSTTNEDTVPSMDYNVDCNDNEAMEVEDVCHFKQSLKGRIYVYDIPEFMRENPRRSWYSRFVGLDNYNSSSDLNFGFDR